MYQMLPGSRWRKSILYLHQVSGNPRIKVTPLGPMSPRPCQCRAPHPGLYSPHPDEREVVQKKTFTKWVNSHLARASCRITDLYKDLRDGRMLIKLLEVLSGETLVKPLPGPGVGVPPFSRPPGLLALSTPTVNSGQRLGSLVLSPPFLLLPKVNVELFKHFLKIYLF